MGVSQWTEDVTGKFNIYGKSSKSRIRYYIEEFKNSKKNNQYFFH